MVHPEAEPGWMRSFVSAKNGYVRRGSGTIHTEVIQGFADVDNQMRRRSKEASDARIEEAKVGSPIQELTAQSLTLPIHGRASLGSLRNSPQSRDSGQATLRAKERVRTWGASSDRHSDAASTRSTVLSSGEGFDSSRSGTAGALSPGFDLAGSLSSSSRSCRAGALSPQSPLTGLDSFKETKYGGENDKKAETLRCKRLMARSNRERAAVEALSDRLDAHKDSHRMPELREFMEALARVGEVPRLAKA